MSYHKKTESECQTERENSSKEVNQKKEKKNLDVFSNLFFQIGHNHSRLERFKEANQFFLENLNNDYYINNESNFYNNKSKNSNFGKTKKEGLLHKRAKIEYDTNYIHSRMNTNYNDNNNNDNDNNENENNEYDMNNYLNKYLFEKKHDDFFPTQIKNNEKNNNKSNINNNNSSVINNNSSNNNVSNCYLNNDNNIYDNGYNYNKKLVYLKGNSYFLKNIKNNPYDYRNYYTSTEFNNNYINNRVSYHDLSKKIPVMEIRKIRRSLDAYEAQVIMKRLSKPAFKIK